jgi:hypothetical protein
MSDRKKIILAIVGSAFNHHPWFKQGDRSVAGCFESTAKGGSIAAAVDDAGYSTA